MPPIVHIHNCAVPLKNPPLLVEQRKRARYAPSIGAIGSVEGANLDSVRGSGCDTGSPRASCPFNIVWMKKFCPTATHDFFGREAGVVEHASIAIIDCPFCGGSPQHFRYGLGHLAQVEFTLP